MKSKVSIPAVLVFEVEHITLQDEEEIRQQALRELQEKDMIYTNLSYEDGMILQLCINEESDPEYSITVLEANKR